MLPVLMLMVWQMLKLIRLPEHHGMLVLMVLHASVAIGFTIREYPQLVKVRQQWNAAEQCAQFINQDPGQVFSIDEMNSLELQINIHTSVPIYRKSTHEDSLNRKPKWILRQQSDHGLQQYQTVWSDQEFELLRRTITPDDQSTSLPTTTPDM
ncbi:MAG: hypothetical protein CMJ19_22455 [Phycisphaeraceae bacterium]|nr:hypothetical protein [Phycisphaeraceae bacterium]